MDFNWVPEALTRLNQYPNERFWGVLVLTALVIVLCTWLIAGSITLQKRRR